MRSQCDGGAYTSTSTSDPAPVVEFAAELGNQVGWVLWVFRLDQVVIVVFLLFLRHGGALRMEGYIESRKVEYGHKRSLKEESPCFEKKIGQD
jgi:hypothetical protein